jgi:hypothetical protein
MAGQYPEAGEIIRKVLLSIEEQEKADGQIRPKGGALLDIGYSLALQGKMPEAIRYFFLAYIDDAMHTPAGKVDDADRGAAFNVLRNVFAVRAGVLVEIGRWSRPGSLPFLQGSQRRSWTISRVIFLMLTIPADFCSRVFSRPAALYVERLSTTSAVAPVGMDLNPTRSENRRPHIKGSFANCESLKPAHRES